MVCAGSFLVFAQDPIPVIFVHAGDSFFLSDVLAQAKEFNERVILLGDEKNQYCSSLGIEYYPMADFFKEAHHFAKIYSHMSHRPHHIELLSFTRWFVLKAFMEMQHIPIAFYCDADVMLYSDMTQEYKNNFDGYNLGLAIQYGFCRAQISFWKTEAITSFCSFLKSFYEDIEQREICEEQFNFGGQEMHDDWPHMANWVHENMSNIRLGNLGGLINNTTFDSSIWDDYIIVENAASSEYKRYQMRDSELCTGTQKLMKDIIWHRGAPYCFNVDLGSFIQFKGLHFQGEAKKCIKNFRSTSQYDFIEPEPYSAIKMLPFYTLDVLGFGHQKTLEYLITTYRPQVSVELGCGLGAITAFMAFLMPSYGKLYAIDCFNASGNSLSENSKEDNQPYTLYEQFLSNIKHYRLTDKVIPIKVSNIQAAEELALKPDLVYIGNCVDENVLYQTIMVWSKKLPYKAILCGSNLKWFESVKRAVKRAANELGKQIITEENFWYFQVLN